MLKKIRNIFSKNKPVLKNDSNSYIKERSNVIQFDCMGYPLRLVINNKGEQQWLDTYEEEGDVVLEWKKVLL